MAMNTREIQTLITLRDEATSQWKKFQNEVSIGAKRIEKTFDSLGPIIGAAFGVYGLKTFVHASDEAEIQTTKLRQALANQGITSEATLQDMLHFSKSMENVVAKDDDAITGIQAMLVAMTGLTGTGVQPLTKAVLDLSAGMNIDAESATRMIGKTAEGAGALKKMGIIIGETSSEEERIDKITEAIEKRFGGLAEKLGSTDAGKIELFRVKWGDLEEKFGDIIKSVGGSLLPALQGIIDDLEKAPPAVQTMALAIGVLAAAFTTLGISMTPVSLGIAAVIAAGAGLASWFASVKEKAASANAELGKTAELDKLVDRYVVLTKNIHRNAEEQGELSAIIAILSGQMPDAVNAWDAHGKSIGVDTEEIKKNIEKRRELARGQKEVADSLVTEMVVLEAVGKGILTLMHAVNATVESVVFVFADMLAIGEKALNAMGITADKTWQGISAGVRKILDDHVAAVATMWGGVAAAVEKSGDESAKGSTKAGDAAKKHAETMKVLAQAAKEYSDAILNEVPGTEAFTAAINKAVEAQLRLERAQETQKEIWDRQKNVVEAAIASTYLSQHGIDKLTASVLALQPAFDTGGSSVFGMQERLMTLEAQLEGTVNQEDRDRIVGRILEVQKAFVDLGLSARGLPKNIGMPLPEVKTPPEVEAKMKLPIDSIADFRSRVEQLNQALLTLGADSPGLDDIKRRLGELNVMIDGGLLTTGQRFQKQFEQVLPVIEQGIGMIGDLMSEAANSRVAEVQAEREAVMSKIDAQMNAEQKATAVKKRQLEDQKKHALSAIDLQLKAEGLSAKQRNALEMQRFKLAQSFDEKIQKGDDEATKQYELNLAKKQRAEEEFRAKEREAKKQAWSAEHAGKLLMAIADTARAVIVALSGAPPPFNAVLAAITAGMAAVQTGIIAGQSAPSFHAGGEVDKAARGTFMNASASTEFPIMVRGGETVRTEDQESIIQRIVEREGVYRRTVLPLLGLHSGGEVSPSGNIQRLHEGGVVVTPIRFAKEDNKFQIASVTGPKPPDADKAEPSPIVNNFHFTFASPVNFEDAVLTSIKKAIRSTGLSVEKLVVNDRSRIVRSQ